MGPSPCRCAEPLCYSAGVFIVAAKRTPFGTYGGVLKDHSATDLAEHAAKAALAAGGVAPELVNSVIVGNVMQVPKVQQITTTNNNNVDVTMLSCMLSGILGLFLIFSFLYLISELT